MTATAERRPGFLADVIVELGLADQEKVDRAKAQARNDGRPLSEVLVEGGTLGESELAQAVAVRHGLPMVDLESFPVDPNAAQLVGRSTARRYGVAPAGFAPDGALLLAMADPTDSLARSDVAVSTRLEVRPVIATRGQINAVIEALPERGVILPQLAPADEPRPAPGSLLWQSDTDPADRITNGFSPGGAGRAPEQIEDRFAQTDTRGQLLRGADSETRIGRLCDQLGERDAQLARLRDEVSQLEATIAARDAQIADLKRSATHRDKALAGLGKDLAAALASAGAK